nr:DEAD/DEAH box helicase [uncultured Anaeromusa sp.]
MLNLHLTDEAISQEASWDSSYQRGCTYHRQGRVDRLRFDAAQQRYYATVRGTRSYKVEAWGDTRMLHYQCNCPAYDGYSACKHIVAVLKAIQNREALSHPESEEVASQRNPNLTPAEAALLAHYRPQAQAAASSAGSQEVQLAVTYCRRQSGVLSQIWLELSIGVSRLYVLKDLPAFLEHICWGQPHPFGKNFTFTPGTMRFDAISSQLFTLIREAYQSERERRAWSGSFFSANDTLSSFHNKRGFSLDSAQQRQFWQWAQHYNVPIRLLLNDKEYDAAPVLAATPPLTTVLDDIPGGVSVRLEAPDDSWELLTGNGSHLYCGGSIYAVPEEFRLTWTPLLEHFQGHKVRELRIPLEESEPLFSAMMPKLEAAGSVQVATTLQQRFRREPLEAKIYLDRYGSGLAARLECRYAGQLLEEGAPTRRDESGAIWLRDEAAESAVRQALSQAGFRESGLFWQLEHPDALFHFADEGLAALQQQAEVFGADDLRLKVRPMSASAGVRLSSTGLVELSLEHEGLDRKELWDILASYRQKKQYHRLKDGAFLKLEGAAEEMLAMVDSLGLSKQELAQEKLTLPRYRALYLDLLARESQSLHVEREKSFRQLVRDIRRPEESEHELPQKLNAQLREYQETGYRWLTALAQHQLGGVLADDMGLGKTVQMLTFLQHAKEQGETKPSLVVAPTSLVYNWLEEASRFTPDLRVRVLAGQQSSRQEALQDLADTDLFITSYGVLRRDIETYQDLNFYCAILDEAQHIKNPSTQAAQAAKDIPAQVRFALTGTPVENSLTELWSIFDFILPGYLRSHKFFQDHFETPIVKDQDQEALQNLSRHIRPFLLRRLKKEVLKELPPKVESKMSAEMTPRQSKVYAAWLAKARQEMQEELTAQGFEQSRIKILALLTRLRQLCCHPALFLDDYRGGSGKLDLLHELLQDALDGGHRMLLFSQFTGMLDLIRQHLAKEGIDCFYLDGATPAQERLRLVNAFNGGEKSVFLISLKAGGTGLNLTGADMVIHYDPWWNPAVEDQATDRAYRIGQKQSVQVYKLIAKNTIEEKIYALQERKKEMIDSVIQPGENFLGKLSEAELRELFL